MQQPDDPAEKEGTLMNRRTTVAVVAGLTLVLSGCSAGGGSGGGSGDPIKIGASIPLTGSLAGFGPLIKSGYEEDVARVNAAGGIEIDGTKRKVELVLRDGKSDPNTVAQQSRDLVLKDGVVALLGSVSPPLAIPAANVAERQRIPFVSTLTPIEAWKGANPAGWKYSWDFFFDEDQMTDNQFKTSDLVSTNKKVALFTDNEQDGITMGKLWEAKAGSFGYTIASHAEFPVGTTDYSSFITKAKSAGAEVLIAQMIPPDSFALWKQMKSLQYTPKVVFCEKCGAPGAFAGALGPLAEGTLTTKFVQSSSDAIQASLTAKYAPKLGENGDLATVLAEYSAAKVLTDAIARAGSTDGDKINAALAKTSGPYPNGYTITFDSAHTRATPASESQWIGKSVVQVYPKSGDTTLQSPPNGLK